MKKTNDSFINSMTKSQRIAGGIYLPAHMFLFPFALSWAAVLLPGALDVLTTNLVYFGIGFIFCLTVMFSHLRKDFDTLLDNIKKVIVSLLSSLLIFWLLTFIVSEILIVTLGAEAVNNPNDITISVISDLAGNGAMIGIAVFLAPFVEETLFRGVLFGSIREKSRFWAYAVSIIVFSVFHLWQYAVTDFSWTLLLYALQYIPAGVAMARSYEKTNCIWAPIFLHMINNAIAMLTL